MVTNNHATNNNDNNIYNDSNGHDNLWGLT